MKIAHYWPNPGMKVFQKYAKDCEFLDNTCDESVDLIYCGSVSRVAKAIEAKKRFSKPVVCWVWDIAYNWREWARNEQEVRSNLKRDAIVKRFVTGLRECDKILSASKYTQGVLKDVFDIDSEQIYFYIKTDEIDAVKNQNTNGHVIQISRYAINKRFDISIRAMAGTNRELICVGIGKYDHLIKLANKINSHVMFYQKIPRNNTIALLKSSSVLVSPSVFEGWGITPIEAIHCGKPILLSDLPVFRETWGDNAMYHRKDDIEDMREKLQRLLADRRLQRRIVDTCRPLISEFTPWKFAERWRRAIR